MVRWTLVFVVAAALAATGWADPFRPSVLQQIDLGKKAAEQIRKEEKVLPASDPRVIELRRIGDKLRAKIPAKELKDRPWEFSFDVIDSKDVNAFALPGGPIFFYTGLLDKMKTEDEVAAVMGHEMTHIRNQHWASQYADNLKRKLGIIVVLSVIGANQDILNATDMLDDILIGLKYSRKHESEADSVGYDLMTETGYNPQGMVDLFQILLDQGGSKQPEFISDHPDTQKRINAIKDRIKKDSRSFPALKPRKSKLASGPNLDVLWIGGWPNLGPISPDLAGTGAGQDPLRKGGGLGTERSRWPAGPLLPQAI